MKKLSITFSILLLLSFTAFADRKADVQKLKDRLSSTNWHWDGTTDVVFSFHSAGTITEKKVFDGGGNWRSGVKSLRWKAIDKHTVIIFRVDHDGKTYCTPITFNEDFTSYTGPSWGRENQPLRPSPQYKKMKKGLDITGKAFK
jgi:hypothetical protein